MADIQELCGDLAAEHQVLDAAVDGLAPAAWDAPTPAEGWTVRDQISHLAFFDATAAVAASDPARFRADAAEAVKDLPRFIAGPTVRGRSMSAAEVLEWWRAARRSLLETLEGFEPSTRVPWYGSTMSAPSFVTARLMETWAHGQDVFDALGARRPATARLRHIAHLGVRALPNSYRAHRRPVPEDLVRVELTGPGGEVWTWGEEGAANVVRGPALDFCLVVTQRRHPDDTRLETAGPVAAEWISIAQAFAGPPGSGRRPGEVGVLSD